MLCFQLLLGLFFSLNGLECNLLVRVRPGVVWTCQVTIWPNLLPTAFCEKEKHLFSGSLLISELK